MSDDSHVNLIHLSNNIGSTTKIPILFPNDFKVWALHSENHFLGIEDNGYLLRVDIIVQKFTHIGTIREIKTQADYNKLLLNIKDIS